MKSNKLFPILFFLILTYVSHGQVYQYIDIEKPPIKSVWDISFHNDTVRLEVTFKNRLKKNIYYQNELLYAEMCIRKDSASTLECQFIGISPKNEPQKINSVFKTLKPYQKGSIIQKYIINDRIVEINLYAQFLFTANDSLIEKMSQTDAFSSSQLWSFDYIEIQYIGKPKKRINLTKNIVYIPSRTQ